MAPSRVLLVANRTATDLPLVEAVRRRALEGQAAFHLVVPATPQGLQSRGRSRGGGTERGPRASSAGAAPARRGPAGQEVTGHVGDANPLAAVSDALHLRGFDEIVLSTLPGRLSRWLRLDLPSKIRGLGLPVHHVTSSPSGEPEHEAAVDLVITPG